MSRESGGVAGVADMAGGGGGERLMPCARAKFEFQAKSDVELSFSAGVSVRLLRRIDDNWLEGELEGRVGIFPASYVEIELGTPSKARESSLASSGRPYAIGLFEFSGDCQGDLSFAKGELIELLGSAGSGWMKGKTGRGEGIFPASFVEIVKLPVTPPASKTSSSPPADEPRRSPEYAEPGQVPVRGSEESRELAREQDLTEEVVREDGEAVFENGFSDDDREEEEEEEEEEGTPVPPPRSKHKSRSLSSSVLLSGEGEGRTTPSRSPPISPRLPGTSPPPRRRQVRPTSPPVGSFQYHTARKLVANANFVCNFRGLLVHKIFRLQNFTKKTFIDLNQNMKVSLQFPDTVLYNIVHVVFFTYS